MIKEAFLTLEDARKIYYKELGQGENLFLIHGNNGDSSFFDKQIPVLSKYFHLILINLRDHGRSGNAGDELNFRILSKDLREIFDLLSIKKAHLLGFSDGANVALAFEILYPERVGKLMLNAPNIRFKGTSCLSHLSTYPTNLFWHLVKVSKRKIRIASLLLGDMRVDREELKKIQKPVMIIIGQYDLIKRDHIEKIRQNILGSSLYIIPGAGHGLARSKSDIFNYLVLEFLKEGK